MKNALLLALVILGGCTSAQLARGPAAAEETQAAPPLAKPRPVILYSYMNSAQAVAQPAAAISAQIQHAQDCIAKLQHASDAQVAGCEGNELAAGAGFYTVDNPFTSHDYGSVVISVPVNARDPNVALITGSFDGGPASGGFSRDITANAKFDGLLYNFRANDFSTRALIVRNANLITLPQARAIALGAMPRQPFATHALFKCSASTSTADVLAHWGDHLEFLSQVFVSFRDPQGTDYLQNGQLNDAGVIAAAASDALAISDAILSAKVAQLKTQSTEFAETLSAESCRETESMSLRSCLNARIYSTLLGDDGTDRRPTYAWSEQSAAKILTALNVAPANVIAGRGTRADIASRVVKFFKSTPVRVRQATDARSCVATVKASIANNHFGTWGDDPQ